MQIEVQLVAARRLQSGSFLTETCGGETRGVTLAEAADASLQSSAYWEYKSFCREDSRTSAGASQNGVWGACKTGTGPSPYIWRTYAKAVAGRTHSMAFNESSKVFRLEYSIDLSCGNYPTEIAISPAQNYPDGFVVTIDPVGVLRVTHDAKNDPFTVYVEADDAASQGQNVSTRCASSRRPSARARAPRRMPSTQTRVWWSPPLCADRASAAMHESSAREAMLCVGRGRARETMSHPRLLWSYQVSAPRRLCACMSTRCICMSTV
eukprot:2989953-Prymnesium_polylepis.2